MLLSSPKENSQLIKNKRLERKEFIWEGRKTSSEMFYEIIVLPYASYHSEPEFKTSCTWAVAQAQIKKWPKLFLKNGSSCSSVNRGSTQKIYYWHKVKHILMQIFSLIKSNKFISFPQNKRLYWPLHLIHLFIKYANDIFL